MPATCPIRHGSTQFSLADLQRRRSRPCARVAHHERRGATAITTLEATEVKLQNPAAAMTARAAIRPALVSVSAFDALASEAAGNTGTFRLTRSGSATLLASPLTVTFTLSGTATNGTDYQTAGDATFLASQATVDVVVTPLVDTTTEGSESVILTLTGVAPYDLGAPATATVTITDTDTPLVSVRRSTQRRRKPVRTSARSVSRARAAPRRR